MKRGLFVLLSALAVLGQSASIFSSKIQDEKYRVRVDNPWNRMKELGPLVDYDFDEYRTKEQVDAYVTHDVYNQLISRGFQVAKVEDETKDYHDWLLKNSPQDNPLLEYHDYNELTTFLQDYAARFPNITSLFSVGKR